MSDQTQVEFPYSKDPDSRPGMWLCQVVRDDAPAPIAGCACLPHGPCSEAEPHRYNLGVCNATSNKCPRCVEVKGKDVKEATRRARAWVLRAKIEGRWE